jgi:hypothetical protein
VRIVRLVVALGSRRRIELALLLVGLTVLVLGVTSMRIFLVMLAIAMILLVLRILAVLVVVRLVRVVLARIVVLALLWVVFSLLAVVLGLVVLLAAVGIVAANRRRVELGHRRVGWSSHRGGGRGRGSKRESGHGIGHGTASVATDASNSATEVIVTTRGQHARGAGHQQQEERQRTHRAKGRERRGEGANNGDRGYESFRTVRLHPMRGASWPSSFCLQLGHGARWSRRAWMRTPAVAASEEGRHATEWFVGHRSAGTAAPRASPGPRHEQIRSRPAEHSSRAHVQQRRLPQEQCDRRGAVRSLAEVRCKRA